MNRLNRLLITVATCAVTFLPGARQVHAHETVGQMMHHDVSQPQHMLMRAYHDNVMNFAHALMGVASRQDTVPRDFTRTAISEMRRSVEELEKHRADALRNMPAEAHAQMREIMDRHLVNVKIHLRELEDLAKRDPVPSQEVMRHLDAMLEECVGMDCGMSGGGGRHGEMMRCCHDMAECSGSSDPATMRHHEKMDQMLQKMKEEDAQLAQKVEALAEADPSERLGLLTEIVTTLVQQRAEMTGEMEKMHLLMQPRGAAGSVDEEDEEDDVHGPAFWH